MVSGGGYKLLFLVVTRGMARANAQRIHVLVVGDGTAILDAPPVTNPPFLSLLAPPPPPSIVTSRTLLCPTVPGPKVDSIMQRLPQNLLHPLIPRHDLPLNVL